MLLACAYVAIGGALLAGEHSIALLVVLLGAGGFGLGTSFSALLEHLTRAATPRHAADISGVFTTSLQVAGAVGVAVFGSAYLDLAGPPGSGASHAFGIIASSFSAAALIAAAMAYRATRATCIQT